MQKKSVLVALACGLALSAAHATAPQPAATAAARADDGMVTFVKKVRRTHRVKRATHRRTTTTRTETRSTSAGSAAK